MLVQRFEELFHGVRHAGESNVYESSQKWRFWRTVCLVRQLAADVRLFKTHIFLIACVDCDDPVIYCFPCFINNHFVQGNAFRHVGKQCLQPLLLFHCLPIKFFFVQVITDQADRYSGNRPDQ